MKRQVFTSTVLVIQDPTVGHILKDKDFIAQWLVKNVPIFWRQFFAMLFFWPIIRTKLLTIQVKFQQHKI